MLAHSITCVTTPPKGAGDPFPDDASFTGGLFVARETFLGGYAAATDVFIIARMAMI
jgi:hypothetical protein